MKLIQGTDWIFGDLPPCRDAAVVAAAEGGDRVIRLLSHRPKRVSVVDRVPAQLHLLELKVAGLKALAYPEYLELSGVRPSRRRRMLYQRVRWLLRKEADEFWRARLKLLDRGVAGQGVFERRLAGFRRFVVLIQGRARVDRFLARATEEERAEAYRREWQTFLWRKFAGAYWKRRFGAPADQLERLLLEGRLFAPPPELREEEFVAAKEAANRLLVVEEPPEDHLRSLPDESIDLFLLGRMGLSGLEGEMVRTARRGARALLVTDRDLPAGFRAETAPRPAGFFPGLLILGSLIPCRA